MGRANRTVLSRYEPSPAGGFFLDVAADKIEDLYNYYDKNAPFVRRDLDQDLVSYLIDCSKELKPEKFEIRLTLAEEPSEGRRTRIRHSITAYFQYLMEKDRESLRRRVSRSVVLVLVGLGMLFASVIASRSLGTNLSVPATVLTEGLTIIAWVAIWEALAVLAIEWFPYHRRQITYSRLVDAAVTIRLRSGQGGDSDDGETSPQ